MEEDAGKLLKGLGADADGSEGSMFSAFRSSADSGPASAPPPAVHPSAPHFAAVSPAPPPPPPPPPPAQPDNSLAVMQFFQARVTELEKRLYDAQEKAMKYSVELKGREDNQRASEEAFERARQGHKAVEQEKKMSDRLDRMETICQKLDGLHDEAVTLGITGGPTKDGVLAMLLSRLDSIESRLSVMEARSGEAAVRSSLRDKLNARDFSTMRDRMDRLEKDSVNLAYIEKRLADSENDSSRVRKLEGEMAFAMEKMGKIDAALQAFGKELSSTAAENRSGAGAMEELRAKFANMAVVFEYLRNEIEQIKKKQ